MFTSAARRPLEGAVRGLAGQTSEQFKDYNPAALRDSSVFVASWIQSQQL